MILPSKELLSEVLNNKLELGDIDRYYLIKDERHLLRLILTDKTDCWNYDINIYEDTRFLIIYKFFQFNL